MAEIDRSVDPRGRIKDRKGCAVTATAPLVRRRAARRTSVALKVVMATTGVLFLLFVLAHMYGNLKVFS